MSFPQSAIVEEGESHAASVREGRYNSWKVSPHSEKSIRYSVYVFINYLTPLTLTIVCDKETRESNAVIDLCLAISHLSSPPQQRKEILPLLL